MSPEFVRLLVAVGDETLRQTLVESLNAAGFVPDECRGGKEALEAARQRPYALVLLGLDSPVKNSLEVCRRLRGLWPDMGIVIVSGNGKPQNEIPALDAGADDFISIPIRFREMMARLGAVLRRSRSRPASPPGRLRAGDLEVDTERRLLLRSGRKVHLSHREFDLLLFFMQNQDDPLTHVRLVRGLWGSHSGYANRHLRSFVRTLRRKIENDPARPEYILTEPWVGYRFRNPDL